MVGNTVYISPLQADSMINQANLFKKLLEEAGYKGIFKNVITVEDLEKEEVAGAIWFKLATFPFIGDAIVPYLMAKKPKVLYVTLEGIMTRGNVIQTNLNRCEFVAVSNFVKRCLEEVGLKVRRVVHHAIDWELCGVAMENNYEQRKYMESIAKDKVKFLVVARDDPRKNLKGLADAMRILNDRGLQNEYVVFLISDESAKDKFKGIENVHFIRGFGGRSYFETLCSISAADYLIHPAFSEGFGLPVLEANACGVPVIHCWMPPLNEFSSKEFNFVFNYVDVQAVKCNLYQYWLFHLFTPKMLAEMMAYAIDVYKNHRDEYEEYKIKAREHAKDWDYHYKYVELMLELKLPLPRKFDRFVNREDYQIHEIK